MIDRELMMDVQNRDVTEEAPCWEDAEPHRILIIEDHQDAADTLGEILRLLGYEVRVAYSGLQGVRLAAEWLPEVVLSDIGLPELDGLDVARELRKSTTRAKLIALSAYGTDEIRRLALQAGFDEFITKPTDLATLCKSLVRS